MYLTGGRPTIRGKRGNHMNGRRTRRLSALLILALVLSAGTYAFAAANTVADSDAGDGDGTVLGYNVTNIRYEIDDSDGDPSTVDADGDPTTVDAVSFDLDKAADEVFAQYNGAGSFYSCTNPAAFSWVCNSSASAQTVVALTTLKVISAN